MQVCNRQDLLSRTDLFTYVYAETSSSRKQGDLFTLTYDGSACSNIGLSVSTVTFHYHMYGASMGKLRVTNAAGKTVGSLSGDQGNSWQAATVEVYSPSFAFEYTRGSSYTGDAAVALVYVSCGAGPPPSAAFNGTWALKGARDEWLQDPTVAEAKYGHITYWDVSNVTNMDQMFQVCSEASTQHLLCTTLP